MDLAVYGQLKDHIFSRQRTLSDIYNRYGRLDLKSYVNSWTVSKQANPERDLFLSEIKNCLSVLYPAKISSEVFGQLATFPLISTVDHLGLLNHPFFLNSNLIFSLNSRLKFLPVLATASVSLNNSSWPGCLVRTTPEGVIKRYSFYPDKIKTSTVLGAPKITEQELNKVRHELVTDPGLSAGDREKLVTLLENVFADNEILLLKTFCEQASVASGRLWHNFFPKAPELICLPIEEVVTKVLIKHIINNPQHVLHRLLFKPEGWQMLEHAFAGSSVINTSAHKGSFLFWGVDQKGRRVHLRREGPRLIDTTINMDLNPEAMEKGLIRGQLYPTSLVCFLTMLYYGITAVGGFNQVNWLTDVKKHFVEILEFMEDDEIAVRIKSEVTDNFAESGLAFFPHGKDYYPAGGVDLFLHERRDWLDRYERLAKTLTLSESMESRLPEIYRVITPAATQDPVLLSVSDEQIAAFNGSSAKIETALF